MGGRVLRPHVLGIDDGPFEKGVDTHVPIVGVMMEGHDLVEAVATTAFPVDGADVTHFLADWVSGLRFRPSLQAIALGGITLAGLALVDAGTLARALQLPILVVNRRPPRNAPLIEALRSAGLEDRIPLLRRAPEAVQIDGGLYLSAAGVDLARARALIAATRQKSDLPEPLRVAHLFARALRDGESRGRP